MSCTCSCLAPLNTDTCNTEVVWVPVQLNAMHDSQSWTLSSSVQLLSARWATHIHDIIPVPCEWPREKSPIGRISPVSSGQIIASQPTFSSLQLSATSAAWACWYLLTLASFWASTPAIRACARVEAAWPRMFFSLNLYMWERRCRWDLTLFRVSRAWA